MTISTLLSKCYKDMYKWLKPNIVWDESRTDEDVLNDVCLTALNKYKDTEITYEEGYDYLRRTLMAELHFKDKRDKKIIYTDDVPDICQPD